MVLVLYAGFATDVLKGSLDHVLVKVTDMTDYYRAHTCPGRHQAAVCPLLPGGSCSSEVTISQWSLSNAFMHLGKKS